MDREDRESFEKEPEGEAAAADTFYVLRSIVTVVLICVLAFTFLGRTVSVVGPSMEGTLAEGDVLVISALGGQPRYGDIVVFYAEGTPFAYPLVKRVIATAGQTIDIDFETGAVYVDDGELVEPYVSDPANESSRLDFQRAATVPEGCVFVMGDNRNRSNDSRDADIGFVDTRRIIGKVVLRLAPVRSFGPVD